MTEQVTMFDLTDPTFLDDPAYLTNPYATWIRMRAEAPACQASDGRWHLSRYEDCAAALRDRRLSVARIDALMRQVAPDDRPRVSYYEQMTRAMMLFSDPPDHTRLRRLAARAFTPRAAETMRPRIQQITDELLDTAPADFDLMRDLALPLPYYVIADLIGVPREDREQVKQWSTDFAVAFYFTPERGFQADKSLRAWGEYLRPLVRRVRESPEPTLLSTLVAAEEDGDRLSEDELFATAILLIFAGHETTTSLIANAVWALLNHPDQLRLLRANPGLITSAIDEVLRYHSPVPQMTRLVTEEIVLGGVRLEPGERVVMLFGAANRDPAVFADPERFDITRSPNPHLAFGDFIHKCIGAPLALVEGQVAIGTLLRRYPKFRFADAPVERKPILGAGVLGLKRFPVHLGQRAEDGL